MGDYLKNIIDRKATNVNCVKHNYRWWFESAPHTIEEFESMLENGELEVVKIDIVNISSVTREI